MGVVDLMCVGLFPDWGKIGVGGEVVGEADLVCGIAVFPKGWKCINGEVAGGGGFNIGAEVAV